MEKKTMAYVCVSVLTFWLFALAFGSAMGLGVHVSGGDAQSLAVQTSAQGEESAAQAAASDNTQSENAQAVLSALQVVASAEASASVSLDVACAAAVLIDQNTGTILYEMNADEPRAVASITKVMTLLLAFEAIHDGKISLEDTVPISAHAFSMGGSQIWLEPGEIFTLEELITAVCVSSANDAAVAIAEYVGGSEAVFVEMMNTRAQELGMTNTTYHNACGLDEEGHLSTARDVAILSCYILETCPEVLNYTGIWTDTLRDGATSLVNTNKLLNTYSGITGLKTGTTGDAGICITASATRDDLSLVAVVLGANNSLDRFNSATTMLDYGFATYEAAPVPSLEECPTTLAVSGGTAVEVALDYSALPESLLLAKGMGEGLYLQAQFDEAYSAPITQGAQLGTVQLYSGEELLGEYPVYAAESVAKMTRADAMYFLVRSLYQS